MPDREGWSGSSLACAPARRGWNAPVRSLGPHHALVAYVVHLAHRPETMPPACRRFSPVASPRKGESGTLTHRVRGTRSRSWLRKLVRLEATSANRFDEGPVVGLVDVGVRLGVGRHRVRERVVLAEVGADGDGVTGPGMGPGQGPGTRLPVELHAFGDH